MKTLTNLMRRQPRTAKIAKERLQIIFAHEKMEQHQAKLDLPMLKQEILQVISKYTKIDANQINIQMQTEKDCSILEMNVTLPN